MSTTTARTSNGLKGQQDRSDAWVTSQSKPTSRTAIQAALGEPDMTGDKFISYVRNRVRTNFRFDREGNLDSINLRLED